MRIDLTDLHTNSKDYLDSDSKSLFFQHVRRQVLPAGTMLVTEGETSSRLYYIEVGLARAYYMDTDSDLDTDDEVTTWLLVEGHFAIIPDSFFQQHPSRYTIQLLERSTVYSISYIDLQKLYTTPAGINTLARQVLEECTIQYEWQLQLLRTRLAERRYDLFINYFGKHVNRFQSKHIASMLGISKYTLSRIRTQKART